VARVCRHAVTTPSTGDEKPIVVRPGQTARLNNVNHTLVEIADPWEGHPMALPPPEGRRLVGFELTGTNIGSQYTSLYDSYSSRLVTDDGYSWASTVNTDTPYSGRLAPGQTLRGWIVFEIDDQAELKWLDLSVDIAEGRWVRVDLTDLRRDIEVGS
jgi:hypothetical protein